MTGDDLSDIELLMACQSSEVKTVTSHMAGDTDGMQTEQCFENFDIVTTLSLTDGTEVRTSTSPGSGVALTADPCCNEGVANGDTSL